MSSLTTTREFFEAKYQDEADPWRFAESDYELSRYDAIIASLGTRFFRRAFEPGCSIGVLTTKLASMCGHLYAIDISDTAVQHAAARCKNQPHVGVNQGSFPADIPAGAFDLIVLSEIGYYYEADKLAELTADLVARLTEDGVLLAAHWLGHSPDHLLSGDQVHEIIAQIPGIELTFSQRLPGFRLDQWTRA